MDTLSRVLAYFDVSADRPSPIEVPGLTRLDLAALFAVLGFGTGAEVGVFAGAYAERLCRANPALRLLCVDPWGLRPDGRVQRRMAAHYAEAKRTLAGYHCTLVRQPSALAVVDVPLGSLDFVYLDGDHRFESVVQDLDLWSQRVRPGGIISGHDYAHFPRSMNIHVVEAVDGHTRAYGIAPWFVVGTRQEARALGGGDHRYRSFLWVKS